MVASTPSDDPDDFERGLFDLERFMSASVPVSAGSKPSKWWQGKGKAKKSKAVAALRDRLSEGRELKDLHNDFLALDVDSQKVFDLRVDGVEAAKLYELGRNPASQALQAARAKKAVTITDCVALVMALGWANVNVHAFAAAGKTKSDPEWWLAWGIEPFLSLILLSIVGARAFMAIRGHVIENPTLKNTERLLLVLALGMSVYSTLPNPVGPAAKFEMPHLILAVVPPIAAVCVVKILPILWAEFLKLDHTRTAAILTADHDLTGESKPSYSPVTSNDQGQGVEGVTELAVMGKSFYPPKVSKTTLENSSSIVDARPHGVDDLVARARAAIADGELPAGPSGPSAYALRKTLRCGMDAARLVRDQLSQTSVQRG